jgi:hypothetical protein
MIARKMGVFGRLAYNEPKIAILQRSVVVP